MTKSIKWGPPKDRKHLLDGITQFVGSPLHSDMTFFIEEDNTSIPAHKFIVGQRSPILEKFVYGTQCVPPTDPITVTNISAKEFLEVVTYLYTDEAKITDSNVLAIMRTANYFDLLHLQEKCSKYLRDRVLTIDNVCCTFDLAHSLNETDLLNKCFAHINDNLTVLLKTDDLIQMSDASLLYILLLNTLNIFDEIDLCEALLRKATLHLGTTATAHSKRQYLDKFIKFIRFPSMDGVQFTRFLLMEPGFMTSEEIGNILACIQLRLPNKTIFESGRRNPNLQIAYKRWDSSVRIIRESAKSELSVNFYVPVLLHGFEFYGRQCRIECGNGEALEQYSKFDEMSRTTSVFLKEKRKLDKATMFSFNVSPGEARFSYYNEWDPRLCKFVHSHGAGFHTRISRVYYELL